MGTRLSRSISEPIREGLSWQEMWQGPDNGLIWCWERGRQKRIAERELAMRAEKGELPVLAWRGGVDEKLKVEKKAGTLNYLATWQGLRGEDLDIQVDGEVTLVCSRTQQTVVFSARLASEAEDEE